MTKYRLKFIAAIMICVAFFYTACQKTLVTSTATTNSSAIGSQIALSLYKSITGQYGGANINNGIKAPNSIVSTHKGPAINAITTLCGYTIDTTYFTSANLHDTTEAVSAHFKFIYNCANNTVNGYTLADSVTTVITSPLFNNVTASAQNYVVQALDTTYKLVSMVGGITSNTHNVVLSGTVQTEYHDLTGQYYLSGVQVNLASGVADITTGTAAFTSTQTDFTVSSGTPAVTNSYNGTITFLGNHMAKVSFTMAPNGPVFSYMINLITGVTTTV